MAGLYDDAYLAALQAGVQDLVPRWGLSPDTRVTLLNISENATFRADDPQAPAPIVLRVHRPFYNSQQEILSELAWIDDLRANGVVPTPRPLELQEGGRIAQFRCNNEPRDVVAFEFVPGSEPAQDANLVDGFEQLGSISARLHDHARRWQMPDSFKRRIWNFDTTLGTQPHWGDWREGLGLDAEGREVLERCALELQRRLAAFGEGPERFGLIHADLRLANLLVDDNRLNVIDFDDCGFGWFAYDFAAAVSFFEHDPIIPALQEAWVRGYRSVAPLTAEDEAMLPTFVMLRRLLLTAWIASHAETPTAQELGSAYTQGTVQLADRFLAGRNGS